MPDGVGGDPLLMFVQLFRLIDLGKHILLIAVSRVSDAQMPGLAMNLVDAVCSREDPFRMNDGATTKVIHSVL